MRVDRRYWLPLIGLGAIALSQLVERLVNRLLRPDAVELTWISEAFLAVAFITVTWLWIRLRDTQVALSDLERKQIVADTQLSIAARVQASLLPPVPAPIAGIHWYAAVEPAQKVGGDYYDFLSLPDGRICIVLGDVSGKGIPAALFLANVRAILRTLVREATDPAELTTRLSAALLADSESGLYVTCIVAMCDPARRLLRYVNAGHPPGVLWNRRTVRALTTGGPPAGLFPAVRYEEETVGFGEGDLVVFVSDGVTEALDVSGDAAVGALAAQMARATRPTPDVVGARLLWAARHAEGPSGVEGWMDDRTAVVFGVPA